MAQAIVQRSRAKLRSTITIIGDDEATGDLQEMMEALDAIQPLLDDAERQSMQMEAPSPMDLDEYWRYHRQINAPVHQWLSQVTTNAYYISDMVDEQLQDTTTRTSPPAAATVMARMLPCLANVPKKEKKKKKNPMMANEKMKDMKQELSRLRVESAQLNLKEASISDPSVEPIIDHHVPEEVEEEAMFVGRGEEIERIMAEISASADTTIIVTIPGDQGSGRTALARKVFNHGRFKHYSRVWVSGYTNWHEIGRSIIYQLSAAGEEDAISNRDRDDDMDYIKRLHQLLVNNGSKKKVLLVLDNIDIGTWPGESLKRFLGVGGDIKGSEVIVIITEREPGSFSDSPTLSDEECWTIIKQRSGFEDRPESGKQELEEIGRDIAKKCGGLPLAAAVLGGMLRYKGAAAGWEEALSSGLWEGEYDSMRTPGFLKLAYAGMPPSLRLCFAYCAIFPPCHNIAKHDLIHQWIALGLLEPSDTLSATQLGEQHIRMLLGMSFLQTTKPPANSTSGKDDKCAVLFTMHENVHRLATIVMHGEFGFLPGATESKFTEGLFSDNNFRYALVTDLDEWPPAMLSLLSARLRALRFEGCKEMKLSDDSFSSASCLRVLEFKENSMNWLPDSICQLMHLRYLNLSGCSELIALPESFGDQLLNLLYIDLSRCSGLAELPESFGKLTNLVNIDLSRCSGLVNLPESFVELMIHQVHINLSGCSGLLTLPRSFGKLNKVSHIILSGCSRLINLPESFGRLIHLKHIDLSGCSGLVTLPESFGDLIHLVHVNLSRCYGLEKLPQSSFRKLEKLEHLDLSFWSCFEVIQTALGGGLTSLQNLNLSHPCCSLDKHRRPHLEGFQEALRELPSLKYLNLSMFLDPIVCSESLKYKDYISCISGVSSLEHLDLSHNIYLRELPASLSHLNKLHTMDLSGCIKLKSISTTTIGEMKSLKSILVRNCRSLKSYQHEVVVHADDDGGACSSSNLVQLGDADFEELEISCLENVKSTEDAHRVRLVEKRLLRKLKLSWTPVESQRSVDNAWLGELVPPHNLQCLELHGYRGEPCLSLMAWWTPRICDLCPNLAEVTLENVLTCTQLPPLGLLPNLQRLVLRRMPSITRIDARDLNFGNSKRLSKFTIEDMENLQDFITTYYGGAGGDEELMFPAIDELVIDECPELRFVPLPPRARRLMTSRSNKVMKMTSGGTCAPVVPLPPRARRLVTSLCRTVMMMASWWTGGGRGVEGPCTRAPVTELEGPCTCAPVVTELVVTSTTCNVPLADWSLLHFLPGLCSLTIENCDMNELPEHLGGLTSLRELHIVSCSSLSYLPESLEDLTSLEKLVIEKCSGITSLPQGIHKLTRLRDLHILDCQKLGKWCESKRNKRMIAHIPNIKYDE